MLPLAARWLLFSFCLVLFHCISSSSLCCSHSLFFALFLLSKFLSFHLLLSLCLLFFLYILVSILSRLPLLRILCTFVCHLLLSFRFHTVSLIRFLLSFPLLVLSILYQLSFSIYLLFLSRICVRRFFRIVTICGSVFPSHHIRTIVVLAYFLCFGNMFHILVF